MLSVGFISCSSDDDDDASGLDLSEKQIREYLESESGTWYIHKVDNESSSLRTLIFRDGKTNGWGYGDFSYWATPYTVRSDGVYITKEDAKKYHGDVLEGGIILTKLTKISIAFYRVDEHKDKYEGTKNK